MIWMVLCLSWAHSESSVKVKARVRKKRERVKRKNGERKTHDGQESEFDKGNQEMQKVVDNMINPLAEENDAVPKGEGKMKKSTFFG